MPTVPRAQRQVQESVLPTARVAERASDEAFGGGGQQVAQAAGQALTQVAQVMEREREHARSLEASNYDREFKQRFDRKLYDPQSGFMALKGKAPSETQKQYTQDFEKELDELIGGVGDTVLKERLLQQKNNYLASFHSATERHAFQEIRTYDNQSTAANLTAAQEMAQTNMYEPGRLKESIDKVNQLVSEFGARNGLPEEAIRQKQIEETSRTYRGVIVQMVNAGDDRSAKALLAEVSDEIDSGTRNELKKLTESAGVRGDSQRMSDEIFGKGLSESEALVEARAIDDPERRDEVVRRIKNRYAESRALAEQETWEIVEDASKQLEQTRSLDGIPPAQWDRLSYKQQMALKKREQQLMAGVEPETDFGKYYQLEQLAAERQQAFGKLNLMEYRPYLSDTDFKKFSKLQASLRGKTGEAAGMLDGIQSKTSIINATLDEMGIPDSGKKADKETIAQANRFRQRVDELVVARQKELGREVNNRELREII